MKLVIFDLDGVIVSTDMYHYQAWKQLADENNLKFDYETNNLLRGVSRQESLQIILDVNNIAVSDSKFSEMTERKNSIYKDSLNKLTKDDILPGTLELLSDLKKNNIKTAIGSSSKNAKLILEKIGLVDDFDVIIDGNDITSCKPHPEIFLKCSEALNISPEDCVVLEDAQAGIDAAKAAGMVAIGIGRENYSNADKIFDSVSELSYNKLNDFFMKK